MERSLEREIPLGSIMKDRTVDLSTYFIYGYMASKYSKEPLSEREKPLPPHGLLFPISNKGSFICITHNTFVTPFEHWLEPEMAQ